MTHLAEAQREQPWNPGRGVVARCSGGCRQHSGAFPADQYPHLVRFYKFHSIPAGAQTGPVCPRCKGTGLEPSAEAKR